MTKQAKLIVLAAFDASEDGELLPAFEPRQVQSEETAKMQARLLALKHAGVIAWSRVADPLVGEYGDPTVLYQSGRVPEME